MNKTEFTLDEIFGDSLDLKLDDNEDVAVEEEQVNTEPKLIKVVEGGVTITDEGLMDKVKKKNLSASMVSSFAQCPADWLMNSFILPLIDHEEPIYFVRGNAFHAIMEDFYAYPKEKRSSKLLGVVANRVIKDQYSEVTKDLETMRWIKEALHGYLALDTDYENVEIAQIIKNKHKGPEAGLEIFVRGKLGDTRREVVGFIDRVDRLEDGTLGIVDYKSGKKIYPFNPDKEINSYNDFGYWRQQLAYAMLLEQDGYDIGGAKLEFPIANGIVEVDVKNKELRRQVEKDFEATDKALDKCIEDNFFPFYGHMFCKWCGMLSSDHAVSRYGQLDVSWEDVNQHVEHTD